MSKKTSKTEPSIKPSGKSKTVILACAVFLTAFLIYAKTINYRLTDLDDNNFIHNCAVNYHPADSFINAFKTNCLFGGMTPYYRPVLSLSFVISDKIAGESESFAHFVNVLLHAVSALLVFIFLRRYLFDEKISFLAAALFAVHPLTVYTAVWIPGRNDSLFFINFILAFTFFIEYLDKKKLRFIFLNVLFTLVCFFTKEAAVSVPLIFVFYYATHMKKYGKPELKKSLLCTGLWVISIVLFLFMRKVALSGAPMPRLNLRNDNIRMFFDYYTSAFFLTTPFRALYGTIETYFYPLGIFAAVLTAFFAFFKKNRRQRTENFFWFALPLIMLAPNIVAERLWFQGNRMYVPLFALIVLLFSFLEPYFKTKKNTVKSIVAVVLLICVVTTLKGSEDFKGNLSFWNKIIEESAYENITAKKFLSIVYIKNDRTQDAVNEALYIAKETNFSDPEILFCLGNAFLQNENYKESAYTFERLISTGQMLIPQVYASLVLAYYNMNDKQKTDYYLTELLKLLNVSPDETVKYVQNYNAYLHSEKGKSLRNN